MVIIVRCPKLEKISKKSVEYEGLIPFTFTVSSVAILLNKNLNNLWTFSRGSSRETSENIQNEWLNSLDGYHDCKSLRNTVIKKIKSVN